MIISGRELAKEIYLDIQKKLIVLASKKIKPKLLIIKSSEIEAVNNYIYQKVKKGEKVGIEVEVLDLTKHNFADIKKLREKITLLNRSSFNHGIIFQKPGHESLGGEIEELIDANKDVDGFLDKSIHKSPVYRGVMKVLEKIFGLKNKELIPFLKSRNIVLIGKGKTGGQTIISGLTNDGYAMNKLVVIDSKTSDKEKNSYIKNADIVISAVGKHNPVDFHLFSRKMILIDIGVHFDEQNKIHGDFDEQDIKDRIGFYTTTPGGIGAMTVAFLMDNVINGAMKSIIN